MTVLFDGTATPCGISRTTNVPDDTAFSMCGFLKIPAGSYVDFGRPFTLEVSDNAFIVLVETNAAGAMDVFTDVDNTSFWSDSNSTWNFFGLSATSATVCTPYVRVPGGAFTALTTVNPQNSTPNYMSFGLMQNDPTASIGQFILSAARVWSVGLTAGQMLNESFGVFPRHWTGLTFWNPMLDAVNPQIDLSGKGGNMTKTSTMTASAEDPGNPWRRSRTYGYA